MPPPASPPPGGILQQFWQGLRSYTPAPHRVVFSSAFLWHALAVRYFVMCPFSTLRAVTHVRPINFTAAEVVQYLGGLNVGYAVLALQALFSPRSDVDHRKQTALVLSLVHPPSCACISRCAI